MKNTVIALLEANMNHYISGEQIASAVKQTRANVWKTIQNLRKKGMIIEASPRLGYKLLSYGTTYSANYLLKTVPNLGSVEILDEIDSTNTYLKSKTNTNHSLVIAHTQTQGRGRMGRQFHSPLNKGIYLSLYLEPQLQLESVQLVTICAGLAVARALKDCLDCDVSIKWLNDIYLNNRKLCGILTEGTLDLECNQFSNLVLGIGLNTEIDSDLPESLNSIYTALDTPVDRNLLISSILNHFYALYHELPNNQFALIEAYKAHSNTLGKKITLRDDDTKHFVALDISPQGHLIVKDEAGVLSELNSGEISIVSLKHEN